MYQTKIETWDPLSAFDIFDVLFPNELFVTLSLVLPTIEALRSLNHSHRGARHPNYADDGKSKQGDQFSVFKISQ